MSEIAVLPATVSAPVTAETPGEIVCAAQSPDGAGSSFEQLLTGGQPGAKQSGAPVSKSGKAAPQKGNEKLAAEMAAVLSTMTLPQPQRAPLATEASLSAPAGNETAPAEISPPSTAMLNSTLTLAKGTTGEVVGQGAQPNPVQPPAAEKLAAAQKTALPEEGERRIPLPADPVKQRAGETSPADGTRVALHVRAMTAQAHPEKLATAEQPAVTLLAETKAPAAVATEANNFDANTPRDSKESPLSRQSSAQTPAVPASTVFSFEKPAAESAPIAVEKPQQVAATVISHVLEAADKMRSDGRSHVELQVKLNDGQELTIKLQMHEGNVRPVFKTESADLRQAIEQSWSGFSDRASERGLQIATPVFESPNAEAGLNNFANRDSRQQQPDSTEAEVFAGGSRPTFSRTKLSTKPAEPVIEASAGVQLYA